MCFLQFEFLSKKDGLVLVFSAMKSLRSLHTCSEVLAYDYLGGGFKYLLVSPLLGEMI